MNNKSIGIPKYCSWGLSLAFAGVSRLRSMFVTCLMAIIPLAGYAYQTVSDGKYYYIGSDVYYVKSSAGNLYVDDGTNQGSVLDGSHWYRRSGEDIMLEHVPSVGFTTGSYWSSGNYYVTYKVWTDGGTNYTWGKFTTRRWNDSYSLQVVWTGALMINLQVNNGQYVHCEGGGNSWVGASHGSAGSYEELTLWSTTGGYLQNGNTVVLGSRNYAKFLAAENGGGSDVNANRDNAGSYERFTLIKVSSGDQYIRSGDQVALQTNSGHYLQAQGGGGGLIEADAGGLGSWETFVLTTPTAISW